MPAIDAIIEMPAIMAIETILRIEYGKTIFYIDTFVALMTMMAEEDIHALISLHEMVSVIRIFRLSRGEGQITIFEISAAIIILRIKHPFFYIRKSMRSRNLILQLFKLLSECLTKTKISSILERIPTIFPSIFILVDRKYRIRAIHSDDGLSREIAFPFIQMSLISPSISSLKSTIRTQCWRWDRVFFSRKSRRHHIVKMNVLIGNSEG